jgi:hypothetical protein
VTPLTNEGRAEPVTGAEPRVARAEYQGLCRCGADLCISLSANSESPAWTPVGTLAWAPEDLERDGLPKAVAVDHADCDRPPSRLARDRGRRVL